MKQILTDLVGDLGNVLRTMRAGYCRWTSALMLLFVVLTAFDMFAYENHVGLPLGGALESALASVSFAQGLHATALTVLPALTLLVVAGLLRSRRLGARGRRLFERIVTVQPPPVSAMHVWTFWIAVTIWIGYMMIGPGLVRNAGWSFHPDATRNLYQPLVLPVMTQVSSFGSWLLVSLFTVLGATTFEFVRRIMAARTEAARLQAAGTATIEVEAHGSTNGEPATTSPAELPPGSPFSVPPSVEKRTRPDKPERGRRPPKSG